MKYAILIISFILDGILSNFLPFMVDGLSLFTPMLTLISILLIFPYYKNQEKEFYITLFIMGLLYDLFYTNLFLFHGLLFPLFGLIIKMVDKHLGMNFYKVVLYAIGMIILYECSFVLFILLFNLVPVTVPKLVYKISHSLLLNIIYVEIIYLLLSKFSKKYMHRSYH